MFAYIDAGTGSIILQVVAGGTAAVVGYLRFRLGSLKFWKKGPATADSATTAKGGEVRS